MGAIIEINCSRIVSHHNFTHSAMEVGPYTGSFHQGGSKAYMPKKVPNIQRIINDILKIVNNNNDNDLFPAYLQSSYTSGS